MIYVHNCSRQRRNSETHNFPTGQPMLLTLRGVRQASRNDSDSIWALMNGCTQRQSDIKRVCQYCGLECSSHCPYGYKSQKQAISGETQLNEAKPLITFGRKESETDNLKIKQKDGQTKKSVKFQQNYAAKQTASDQSNKFQQSFAKTTGNKPSNKLQISTPGQQNSQRREKYLRECYSIDKYFQKIKPYTREMPNSALRLFYEKPCLETYGNKNTQGNSGFIYNDYMKTHNVQPHRHQNEPMRYQTYRSALNFGKRAKLDPEQRWRRIHRQMIKKLDIKSVVSDFSAGFINVNADTLNETLKLNIGSLRGQEFKRAKSADNLNRTSSIRQNSYEKISKLGLNSTNNTDAVQEENSQASKLKKSKSLGKKQYLFLYKYEDKDGDVQFCKDRHGITCYVDPSFEENKQAYAKFLRNRAPLEAEGVAPGDRNIDKIMVANYLKSKNEELPRHYLMPNCQQPYRPEKYSLKARKRSLAATAGSDQLQIA